MQEFPARFTLSIADPVNQAIQWLVVHYGEQTDAISASLLFILLTVESVVRGLPWWVAIGTTGITTYALSQKISTSLLLSGALFGVGVLGLWDLAMQTMALMIVSVALSVFLGFPTGFCLARTPWLRKLVLPLLDMMQTMPSFVYLVPFLMLFGLGKVSAMLATVVYSVAPTIRFTELGIRLVDENVLEAARSCGASESQVLLGVQIPLALPTILGGLNQTIMMALSMVVLASMIGARGLGEEVLLGIQRLDVGRGLTAGVAIVLLAIVMDRLTQSLGRRFGAKHVH